MNGMSRQERVDLDAHITGHWGEDNIPDDSDMVPTDEGTLRFLGRDYTVHETGWDYEAGTVVFSICNAAGEVVVRWCVLPGGKLSVRPQTHALDGFGMRDLAGAAVRMFAEQGRPNVTYHRHRPESGCEWVADGTDTLPHPGRQAGTSRPASNARAVGGQ